MRDEVLGEVEDSILFLKEILLFYTIALPKDWGLALRVGGQQEGGRKTSGRAKPLE